MEERLGLYLSLRLKGDLQRSGRVDMSHISYEDINGERVQTPIRSIRLTCE